MHAPSARLLGAINGGLPKFPEMVPIDFPVRAELEQLTAHCPEHGDFQFTSL
jgi:hypothetical protein